MLFFRIATVLSPLLFIPNIAALSASDVVTNINIVTAVSGNLNGVLGGLTTSTDGPTVQTIGQTAVTAFQTIITDLGNDVTAMKAACPEAIMVMCGNIQPLNGLFSVVE